MHDEFLAAGSRLVGISVDDPAQNAAMVEKLMLPFPLLSDPDRTLAIEPYGVADPKDQRNIARPATVVVGPDRAEVYRSVGDDFADRPFANDVLAAIRELDLAATTQPSPEMGPAEPGPSAFPFEQMLPYYRGARFAAIAMGMRFPEAKESADAYVSQLDEYTDAAKATFRAKRDAGQD